MASSTNITDAAAIANRELDQRTVEAMQARFDRAALNPDDQLSYDLLLYRNARSASIFPYRRNAYVFDQMNGAQADIPAFLINIHKVDSEADARAYISRLAAERALHRPGGGRIDRAREARRAAAALGVPAGHRAIAATSSPARRSTAGKDNDLFADFKTKVGKLADPAGDQGRADRRGARRAMLTSMRPAYQRLIATLTAQAKRAGTDDGIWRFADGAAQYKALLKYYTTTDLDGDQVHALGLAQVARIHGEMNAIKERVGFAGTLQQFFAHIRDGKQFYYPNTAAGKQTYLDESIKAEAQVAAALAALLRAAAQVEAADQGGRAVPREECRQGLLPGPAARRLAPRHLLRQPLRHEATCPRPRSRRCSATRAFPATICRARC